MVEARCNSWPTLTEHYSLGLGRIGLFWLFVDINIILFHFISFSMSTQAYCIGVGLTLPVKA